MAAPRVRRWTVQPDTSIMTRSYGEIPCVSRDAMVRAIMDGESMLAITGGTLSVVTTRHPTDLPGEAVTSFAVLEWKDGARATLPDPPKPAPVVEEASEEEVWDGGAEEAHADLAPAQQRAMESIDNPDDFPLETLEDEDLSALPVEMR